MPRARRSFARGLCDDRHPDDHVRRQLHDYLELWAQGIATAEAVERAFGAKIAELDARIERYSLQSTVGCVRLEPKDGLDLPEIRVRRLRATRRSTGSAT